MGPLVARAGNARMEPEVDGQILSRDRRAPDFFLKINNNNNNNAVI